MSICVFVGPTLTSEDVNSVVPDAVALPPVAQGDVYRAVAAGAQAVGIVDGYFSGAPSVWHKEILWALSEGVAVFGSASMGALRAAELHGFGMRGVGRIFEAFRDGELEDDDEVAVVHGPAETGFLAASEPMVNIRASLARAEAHEVISAATRSRLEAAAKSLFFPHRTWPAVLRAVADECDGELLRFEAWLGDGAIDQKRQDALEMLAAMRATVAAGQSRPASFRFERTHFWDDLVDRAAAPNGRSGSDGDKPDRIIDELRLEGLSAYENVTRNALLRLLSDREAGRRGLSPSLEEKRATSTELRKRLGLFSQSQLEDWLRRNDLDAASYERLIESETCRQTSAGSDRRLLEQYLLDELRLSGRYEALAERARGKAETLGSFAIGHGHDLPNMARLRAWYFETRLGEAMPDDVEHAAQSLGFPSAADLDRALRDEFVYSRLPGNGQGKSATKVDSNPSDVNGGSDVPG